MAECCDSGTRIQSTLDGEMMKTKRKSYKREFKLEVVKFYEEHNFFLRHTACLSSWLSLS